MSDNEIKKDLLSQLLYEAQAYKKFDDIERLVESGTDLSMLPVQPLYVSLQTTTSDQIAAILPKLSSEQRQALRDIDLWQKDTVDSDAVYHWIDIYSKCPDDEVILEYLTSEDFLLSLKNQFTIQTFDVEDPMYPDGDNYFLTEDNQLLIEYPENFNQVQELKELIRRLYSEKGVENAYAFLFKMVVDSYQLMEEEAYREKTERLRDFGFVDYYEALQFNSPFAKIAEVDAFISSKKGLTAEIDPLSANQNLHASALVPYQSGMEGLKAALDRVSGARREQYLHFNFIRLVNARMSLEDALKSGSLAMTKVGQHTRQCLELGFDYTSSMLPQDKREKLFDLFDFVDLYKVGHSLIEINKRRIKRALGNSSFEKEEFAYFLGLYWNSFLENSLDETAKYKFDGSSKALEITDNNSYRLWLNAAETFIQALPFVETFFHTLEKLKSDNLLNNEFYLNYEVDSIDFEAIIISSFMNFVGGFYNDKSPGKMGVTPVELKNFYHEFFIKHGQEYLIKGEEDPVLREKSLDFMKKFGLEVIPGFDKYLYQIMVEQLNGYEIDGMEEEDFQHIGGPILLNASLSSAAVRKKN